ncbi:MAG: type II secretion system protein M [Candidatus Thiodiazotropha sp. (ex Gloverina cf. vestifex)]|nr:type II secretion system protein M [Candidatus Thiodiazotropha sp. (ex Gloverina cf. vestifex)]
MKTWWLTKTPWEQLALILTAAALLLFLLYLMAWQPFSQAVEQKHLLVKSQQATLSWMQNNLSEIQHLRGSSGASRKAASNEALLTLVDRTAKQRQLRQQIQRIKPQGDQTVQLWVEQVAFDTLLIWLGELTQKYGIQIDSLNIDRQELPGLVNARLVLQRGGGA